MHTGALAWMCVWACFFPLLQLIQQYFPIGSNQPILQWTILCKRSRLHYFKNVIWHAAVYSRQSYRLYENISPNHRLTHKTSKLREEREKKMEMKIHEKISSNNNCKALFRTNFERMAPKIGNSKKDVKNVSYMKVFLQSWFISCGKSENIVGVKKSLRTVNSQVVRSIRCVCVCPCIEAVKDKTLLIPGH